MNILRLVLLALLFYIGWSLLRGLLHRGGPESERKAKGTTAGDAKVQDILVEDPVCHKLVPKHQAVRMRKDGTTYYFCSEECCDRFTGTPRGEK